MTSRFSPEYLQITCSERLKLGGLLPAWFETTLGGRVRAVWTFEAPVMMLGTKFANEYLHAIGKQLDVDQFLPGIDRKSFGCEMRWTNGGYWTQIEGGAPLPAALTQRDRGRPRNQAGHPEAFPFNWTNWKKALLEKHPRFAEFNGGRLEMKKTGRRFWDDKGRQPKRSHGRRQGLLLCGREKKPW